MLIAGCGDDAATSSTTTIGAPIDTTGAHDHRGRLRRRRDHRRRQAVAPLGQTVVIKVTSDIADEIHLHGYDKKADAAPGTVATITFKADKPGIFEVELEKKGLKLFELEVK